MLKRFLAAREGYALVLTLLFLPVFIGVGLLVVDIGRGNNAHSDHQAAADALALAGARELDGRAGARARAREAMAKLTNSVSFLGMPSDGGFISLAYAESGDTPFTVAFLSAIPASDDTRITQAWLDAHAATDDLSARYVYVHSQARDLLTFFLNPVSRERASVPIGASAVATLQTATCDLTPIFICNPVSGTNNATAFETAIKTGDFHGRLLKLPSQTSNADMMAGNVGFLRTVGSGSAALRRAMAGESYPECVELDDGVDTQPGTVNSVWDAYNTRFDIYNDNAGDWSRNGISPPAQGVRKGYVPQSGTCASAPSFQANPNTLSAGAQKTAWYAANPVFSDNRDPDATYDFTGTGDGNSIRSGIWNLNEPVTLTDADGDEVTYAAYWPRLHGNQDDVIDPGETLDPASVTSRPGRFPSRYDVYRYELARQMETKRSKGGEVGNEQCYSGTPNPGFANDVDRRTMLVAVVNCSDPARPVKGQETDLPVQFWAEVFLVNPGSKGTLDIEIVDIAGEASTGSIDRYFRTEALLVR